MPPADALPAEFRSLFDDLAALLPARRGSVSVRFMKCGQPSCACRRDPAARHGPYVAWTRVVGGKTQSKLLSSGDAEAVRRQVAAGRDLRALLERLWEAAERWADAELDARADASPETAEKGGSARHSRRNSKPRSSD